jgi:hypothetical protein
MVGALGLTLAGGSPGGLSGTTGFLIAFASTFLLIWGVMVYVGQRQVQSSESSEEPGQEPQFVPRGPIPPTNHGGKVKPSSTTQYKPTGRSEAPERGREAHNTDES